MQVRETLKAVAATTPTVLIHGESGTGKEIAASLLHQESRRHGPFVPVNMAAIPRELVESILFGHEKGAFTGADRAQAGCCEMADHGTLFLDEIGEMDLSLQAKLLRFLQDFTVQRVGSTKSKTVDVRVVAATNQPLADKVKGGLFREDLYYRLHIVPIRMPALRERPGDIPLLANRFLQRFAHRYRKEKLGFSQEVLQALATYSWPGNVRQLENLVERMVILSHGPVLEISHLPSEMMVKTSEEKSPGPAEAGSLTHLEALEKQAIVESLVRSRGNIKEAARYLGVGSATVYRKIKRYAILMNDQGRLPTVG